MYKVDPSAFFSGSAKATYKPSKRADPGVGCSMFHSITAMKEYENFSNEEIRIQDYNAACGLFGSKIAKIGAALCVDHKNKLRPSEYGEHFQKAVANLIEEYTVKQEHRKLDERLGPSVTSASAFKMENGNQDRLSGSPRKTQYTKIVVVGTGVNVNLVVNGNATIKEDEQPSQSTNLCSPLCDRAMQKTDPNLSDSEITSKTKRLFVLKSRNESREEIKREEKLNLKSEHVSLPSQQINPAYHKKYGRGFRTSNRNSSRRNQKD